MKINKRISMVVSVLRDKTKIVLFEIDKDQNIVILNVTIIKKSIENKKISKTIKDLSKSYNITIVVVSIYNGFNRSLLDNFPIYINLIVNNLFSIYQAIKYSKDDMKLFPKLLYIDNGWIDFSLDENIDINGLVLYVVNELNKKVLKVL